MFTLFKTLSYNLTLISSLFADGIHLEKGMKGVEVTKLCDISLNTITKVRKNLQLQQRALE